MPIQSPSFNANISSINNISSSYTSSTFISKGAPRPISNELGKTIWVPKDSLIEDENTVFKKVTYAPDHSGQLFWSSVVGDYENGFNITQTTAQLFVSIPKEWVLDPLPSNANNYIWVPILLDSATSYKDPATGRTWDPVGLYTCNPPYLCVDS